MLVGKVNKTGEDYDEEAFFAELEALMYKYGVNRVEAYWGVPRKCHVCHAKPALGDGREDITLLDGDDPRLAVSRKNSTGAVNRKMALDMLEGVRAKKIDIFMRCDDEEVCEPCEGCGKDWRECECEEDQED